MKIFLDDFTIYYDMDTDLNKLNCASRSAKNLGLV